MKKKTLCMLLAGALSLSFTASCFAADFQMPSTETGVTKADGTPVTDPFSFFAYTGDDALPHEFHNVDNGQTVYMTTDISPEGLTKIYEALGVSLDGNVAVKLSTGENGSNYLDPQLIKDLVQEVNGTIVECNTAYGGNRSETAMHRQLIEDHGFADIAEVDIMDEEGSMEIPVTDGTYLEADYVGSHLQNYDSMLVLSHFKGHPQGGVRRCHQEHFHWYCFRRKRKEQYSQRRYFL